MGLIGLVDDPFSHSEGETLSLNVLGVVPSAFGIATAKDVGM